jgi:hypothetical protein
MGNVDAGVDGETLRAAAPWATSPMSIMNYEFGMMNEEPKLARLRYS